ncbi:MAG: hypothetical protein SGJ20_01125 [Planctomycetota bacterium]|nr:hypothetical protein [Planctomycetota bacterium]
MNRNLVTAWILCGLVFSQLHIMQSAVAADDDAAHAKSLGIESQVIISGLDHPFGLAVQPGSGIRDVFVSNSGAGEILRIDPKKLNSSRVAVSGFTLAPFSKHYPIPVGPLGLGFVDQRTLLVGDAGGVSSESASKSKAANTSFSKLRTFSIPADGKTLEADAAKHTSSVKFSGNLKPDAQVIYSLAVSPGAVYLSTGWDDSAGTVLRASNSGSAVRDLKRLVATKEELGLPAPLGIAVSKRGELLVGQAGAIGDKRDSRLAFYHGTTAQLLLNLETGLSDITGLAYNPDPTSGRLYAIDAAWGRPSEGGLYRLDAVLVDGKQKIKAIKLLSLEHPTAMAFANNGTLYVTTLGPLSQAVSSDPTGKTEGTTPDPAVASEKRAKSGSVIKITGAL